MTDMINPAHYHGDRKYEPIDVIEDWDLNYRLGCALKYISRNGRKPGEDPCEGLRKAIWYLEREIASHEKPGSFDPDDEMHGELLSYYGQTLDEKEAWPELAAEPVPFEWTGLDSISFNLGNDGPVGSGGTDTIFSVNDFWMETPDYVTGWDSSLGPIEISTDEVANILSRKDLNQFNDDEIVASVEKRGFILGIKKDGTTCELRDGRCV